MADATLDHSASALNRNFRKYDKLSEKLTQAHAMVTVASSAPEHFIANDDLVVQAYFWLLNNLLSSARSLAAELFEEDQKRKAAAKAG